MTIYQIRTFEPSATGSLYFATLQDAIHYLTNGKKTREYTCEVPLTGEYIGTEYEYKVTVKAEPYEEGSLFAEILPQPKDEVYLISGHDLINF